MLRDDRELLADLKRICNAAGPFVLAFLAGDLSSEAEEDYASALVALGERLLAHARNRAGLVLEVQPAHVLDAPVAPAEHEPRQLLADGQSDNGRS